MEELVAAQRWRTLLNMLVRLEDYERIGAAHAALPPSADYWGRRGVERDADAPQEIIVVDDEAEAAVVTFVLNEMRNEWDVQGGAAHGSSFPAAPAPRAVKLEAGEETVPAVAGKAGEAGASLLAFQARDWADGVLFVLDVTGSNGLLDQTGMRLTRTRDAMDEMSGGTARVEGRCVALPLRAPPVPPCSPAFAEAEPCKRRLVVVLAATTAAYDAPAALVDATSGVTQTLADAAAAVVAAAAAAAQAPGGQLLLEVHTCGERPDAAACVALRSRLDAAAAGRLAVTLTVTQGATLLGPTLSQRLRNLHCWQHGRGATERLSPQAVLASACDAPMLLLLPPDEASMPQLTDNPPPSAAASPAEPLLPSSPTPPSAEVVAPLATQQAAAVRAASARAAAQADDAYGFRRDGFTTLAQRIGTYLRAGDVLYEECAEPLLRVLSHALRCVELPAGVAFAASEAAAGAAQEQRVLLMAAAPGLTLSIDQVEEAAGRLHPRAIFALVPSRIGPPRGYSTVLGAICGGCDTTYLLMLWVLPSEVAAMIECRRLGQIAPPWHVDWYEPGELYFAPPPAPPALGGAVESETAASAKKRSRGASG